MVPRPRGNSREASTRAEGGSRCGYDCLDEDAGVAYRGVYLLDPEGNVQSCIINNLPVGRNVAEVLRTLKGFQYVTSHDGEVCPANWEEGADTMSANPDGVAKYLGSH